ncbi:MAG: hypothetical protein OEY91_09515 [Nitrospirota bacterium]|nr:hypothetical protein [Nitrospirota bacterium]
MKPLCTTIAKHLLLLAGVIFLSPLFSTPEAQAIPAFARKYDVNCTVCHARVPRLNRTGERFLENGYQLPGTEDGDTIKKSRLGDLTLDDVTNYLGFRMRGNILQTTDYARHASGTNIDGNPEDRTELGFPEVFSLLTAGTITNNVGFFAEVESNLEEGETGVERAFVTFNNIGQHDWAHLRIGKFDPSAYSSYATLRQQFELVGDDSVDNGSFMLPTINRIGLTPAAFASKFSGLFDRSGTAIVPTAPSLFHAVAEMGLDIHGRPFGDWFLYQVGILNGANEPFGDSNNPKDWYVMTRFDLAQSNYFSANFSGFAYFGSNNAKVSTMADVNWSRYGFAANVRYDLVDVYAAFVVDQVTDLPASLKNSFDSTATGLTVEANVLATDRILFGIRFDHLHAGGLRTQRTNTTLLALIAKYYLRSNIAVFLRDDINLRQAQGGHAPERNFRNAFFVGADVAF